MSESVRIAAEQFVDALEAEWVDPNTATDEELEALLERRQEILSQFQSLDATVLDQDTQQRLRARMNGLQERDQQLTEALRMRLELITNQLGNAAQGRAAVRGYRSPDDDEAKILIRPA